MQCLCAEKDLYGSQPYVGNGKACACKQENKEAQDEKYAQEPRQEARKEES
jgi:hypothetical protein